MSYSQLADTNFPAHGFRWKMGGGGQAAQQIQSAPVPMPAPPVTQSNTAVVQAEHDIAQANLAKKSVKKTTYAGETGGWGNPMGKNSGQPNPLAAGGSLPGRKF